MKNNTANNNALGIILIVFGFVLLSQGIGSILMKLAGLSADANGVISTVYAEEYLKPSFILCQLFASLIGLLIVPYFFLTRLRQDLYDTIRANSFQQSAVFALLGIILIITAMPLVSSLGTWNQHIVQQFGEASMLAKWEKQVKELYQTILSFNNTFDLILVIVAVAILPGIAEEFVFRGILQNELKRYINPHLAVLVTALIFSIIHFQFTGILPRWYLGILLGYVYLFSNNIYLSMLVHFTNNFVAIMAYYLHQKGHITTSPEQLDAAVVPAPLMIASASFATLILVRMWRMRNPSPILHSEHKADV